MTNYYQTIHEKPSFGGLLSRAREETLAWVGQEPALVILPAFLVRTSVRTILTLTS